MPLLDLTNADLKGFGAIPGGTYHAELFAGKMDETKGGPDAKVPKGTPRINLQFKIVGRDDEIGEGYEFYNRRVFASYTIPPPKYDKQKAAIMNGMIVKTLKALGYTDEELSSDEFDLNFDDIVGRSCRVVVTKKVKYGLNPEDEGFDPNDPENFDNNVTGVKPPSAALASGGSGLT